jgi:beta-galactosidase
LCARPGAIRSRLRARSWSRAEQPAITHNSFGKGGAYYVGTVLKADGLDWLMTHVLAEADVQPPLQAPSGVEALVRKGPAGEYLFLLNHNAETVAVNLPRPMTDMLTGKLLNRTVGVPAYGVLVLK